MAAYDAGPLKISKSLYRRKNTKAGPVIEPLRGPIQVGDEIVVRLSIEADREMEYVHVKDQRPSGAEPVAVLSHYTFRGDLSYYQSTLDSTTHFFIDRLPQGTNEFEYVVRIVHKGQYQSGMASIQCLYAPEFNGHSRSYRLVVAGD